MSLSSSNKTNSENFEKSAKASEEIGKVLAETGFIKSGETTAAQISKLINDDVASEIMIQNISNFIKSTPSQTVSNAIGKTSKMILYGFKKNANNFKSFLQTIEAAHIQNDDFFKIIDVKSMIFAEQEIIIKRLELCTKLPNKIISNSDINKAAFCMELHAMADLALKIDNELSTELNNYISLISSPEGVDYSY